MNSFKINTFLKLVADNVNFVAKLERKITTKKKEGLYIYIPMHILSDHTLIKEIVNYYDIFLLPDVLIDNNKFRAKVTDEQNNIIYVYMYKDKNEINKRNNFKIKKIKLEYLILYDAASAEAQRTYDKSLKNKNKV